MTRCVLDLRRCGSALPIAVPGAAPQLHSQRRSAVEPLHLAAAPRCASWAWREVLSAALAAALLATLAAAPALADPTPLAWSLGGQPRPVQSPQVRLADELLLVGPGEQGWEVDTRLTLENLGPAHTLQAGFPLLTLCPLDAGAPFTSHDAEPVRLTLDGQPLAAQEQPWCREEGEDAPADVQPQGAEAGAAVLPRCAGLVPDRSLRRDRCERWRPVGHLASSCRATAAQDLPRLRHVPTPFPGRRMQRAHRAGGSNLTGSASESRRTGRRTPTGAGRSAGAGRRRLPEPTAPQQKGGGS